MPDVTPEMRAGSAGRKRLAILVERMLPYHHARMRALGDFFDVGVIEIYPDTRVSFAREVQDRPYNIVRLNISGDGMPQLRRLVHDALTRLSPDVVAIPGWSLPYSIAALEWCVMYKTARVLISDSTQSDKTRSPIKEAVKKRIISMFGSAFVAGSRSADYLVSLSFVKERIFFGYDVVDNLHFSSGAEAARIDAARVRSKYNLPERYILVCCRLIPEKNLFTLLQAVQSMKDRISQDIKFMIAGDGSERRELERCAQQLNISGNLIFRGRVDYADLPAYYGLANGMILPSLSETWGLVVNEALAAGIPVAVSSRCGCVPELVANTTECMQFDPHNIEEIAGCLVKLAERNPSPLTGSSVDEWGLDRHCHGLVAATDAAINNAHRAGAALSGLALQLLARFRL